MCLQSGGLATFLDAIVELPRRALKRQVDLAITAVAFAGLAVLRVPYPILIGLVALVDWWLRAGVPAGKQDEVSELVLASKTWTTIFVWAGVWLVPLALVALLVGSDYVLTQIGTLFATIFANTFVGSHATLAFHNQTVVARKEWLSAAHNRCCQRRIHSANENVLMVLPYCGLLGALALIWLSLEHFI